MSVINEIELMEALKLNREQISFLELLIGFSNAVNEVEKEAFLNQIKTFSYSIPKVPAIAEIESKSFDLYEKWYHQVVRSLIELYDFAGDYRWLAQKVFPAISEQEAKESVVLLENLGLITRDEQGVYRSVDKHITTGVQTVIPTLRTYYEKTINLGIQALATVEKEQRNVSGLVLGISEKTYKEVIKRIARLRKELVDLSDKDSEADRVYNLTMLCFPVSSAEEK